MNFLDRFSKNTHIKFNENPFGGSRVIPRGRTNGRTDGRTDERTDGRADMTKLIVAFRNFANAPKNDICKIESVFNKSVCACA